MAHANEVMNKVYELVSDSTREMWHELPTDVDYMVAHDFFRDVLKQELIDMVNSLTVKLQNESDIWKSAKAYALRNDALEGLGLIEVYIAQCNQ